MNNQVTALIEKYFNGTLSEQEKQEFENRLKKDASFKKSYEEEKRMKDGIAFSVLHEAQNELKALESSLPALETGGRANQHQRFDRKTFLGIAASFTLILVSFLIYLSSRPHDADALFREYFEVYPNEVHLIKRAGQQQFTTKDAAFDYYNRHKYDSAVASFEDLLIEYEDPDVLFYLANALAATEDYENAVFKYQKYLELNRDFTVQAQWYLALCYVKLERFTQATTILKKLQNQNNSYSEEAGSLISQIEKIR